MYRMLASAFLLTGLCGARVRAQAQPTDTLVAATRDSVLDAVLHGLDVTHEARREELGVYLSPYRGTSSDLVATGPRIALSSSPRHDAGWLQRAQAAFRFTAICGSVEGQPCPRQNGSVEVTLGAPEPQADGRVVVAFEVRGVAPSPTERHAIYATGSTLVLARGSKGWEVAARGQARHDDGTLTDPLPLR